MWFNRKHLTKHLTKHLMRGSTARSSGSGVAGHGMPVGCPHVLVLHADGSRQCDGGDECGTDELLHDWWVACDELRCGCVGEEHDLVVRWADAA